MVPEHEDKTCSSRDLATTRSHNLAFGLSRVQLHRLKTRITQNVDVRAFAAEMATETKSPVER